MIDKIVRAVEDRVSGRFVVDKSGHFPVLLVGLSPPALAERRVLRLRRTGRQGAGWRTVLLTILATRDNYQDALRWAAEVRQELREPEASDLYLWMSGPGLKGLESETIESNEHFCRKLVIREREQVSLDDFMDRSFLAQKTASAGVDGTLVDPLTAALADVVHKGRLNSSNAQTWRVALATMPGGKDLAEQLRSDWLRGREST
ncbi:ABC-three component system middle component 1 [Sorangium sp. So ce1335]|uniref:ABC-three component system middle component 1 n=1 Tax=Sorangium sp. So ce1335 TaxID=3133335 RepID=UPI003F6078FA